MKETIINGRGGHREKRCLASMGCRYLKQWMKKAAGLFREEPDDVLGAGMGADGTCCLIRLHAGEEEKWHVEAPVTWQTDPDADTGPSGNAERCAIEIAKRGWDGIPIVAMVPASMRREYLITLPPGMDETEQHEAAYWELDDKLVREGIQIEQTCTVCRQLSADRGVWIAAVDRDIVESMTSAFCDAELPLKEILCVPPPDSEDWSEWTTDFFCTGPDMPFLSAQAGREAALAATVFLMGERDEKWRRLRLLTPERIPERWNYRRLAAALFGVIFLSLCLMTGWDSWKLYEAGRYKMDAQAQLGHLSMERRQMEMLERVRRETERKEKCLVCLSSGNIPWYSMLVHFGTMTTEGVWLENMEMQDGQTIVLKGRAVSYGALSDFVKRFERDTELFPHGPVLDQSEIQQEAGARQEICFRMMLQL